MSGASPILSVNNVSFFYGPGLPNVLNAISLDIAGGTITALLGPNGSGKTTLMNLILGWLSPVSGSIEVSGKPLDAHSRRELSSRIGLVPQDEHVTFELSAVEYVLLGRAPYLDFLETPGEEDRRLAGQALEDFGLAALRDRSVSALSGGERQLVILARALVQDPWILLLDEPMSHLDIGNTRRILQVMAGLKKNGKTIVFTTHDPNIAAAADDVVLLRAGRLLAFGPTASTLNAENLSATYGVRVDVVILDGRPVILTCA
jgi:iron complex transport system ATP-binding protein